MPGTVKNLLLIGATLWTFTLAAVDPRARIDVDGRAGQIGLKLLNKPAGGVAGNAEWAGANKPYYLVTQGPPITGSGWQVYTFSFVPDKEGDVIVRFAGYYYRESGDMTNLPVWTSYDNIEVTGAILLNGDFEEEGAEGKPAEWTLDDPAQYIKKSDGKYIKVWHNRPAIQMLHVTAGQPVTIKAMTSACENRN